MNERQESVESIIKIDLDDVSLQLTNIWKMVWEQVILLSLYSRGQYFEIKNIADAINFNQRMRLIHTLDNLMRGKRAEQEFKDQCRIIIDKVESNSGSNEILELLFDDSNEQKTGYGPNKKTIKERVRDEIEKEGIAFPPSDKTMQFSYYAMYKSLTNLIPLLQLAASYSEPSVVIVREQLFEHIRTVIQDDKNNGVMPQDIEKALSDLKLTNEQYIKENLRALEGLISNKDKYKSIVSDFYHQLIVGNIDDEGKEALGIGSWAKKVFDFTSLKSEQEAKDISDFYILHEEDQTGRITVSFDKNKLINIINLGLMKPLLHDIGFQAELLISKQEKNKNTSEFEKQSDINALQAISEWYDHKNTGLFIRSNQIPKLVAYLLSCDIENNIGIYSNLIGGYNLCNRLLKYLKNPKKASERNLHIILVMKYCLYHHMDLSYLYNNLLSEVKLNLDKKTSTAEQYMMVIEQLNDLEETMCSNLLDSPNELFEDWANLLSPKEIESSSQLEDAQIYNRIMNRFKRPPKYNINGKPHDYFSSELLDNLVKNQRDQKHNSNPIAYPFNSSFPLPLWVKR